MRDGRRARVVVVRLEAWVRLFWGSRVNPLGVDGRHGPYTKRSTQILNPYPWDSCTLHQGSQNAHGAGPHDGLRPFHQKATCLTRLTLGPYVVQIWSCNPRISEATKPAHSSMWRVLAWLCVCVCVCVCVRERERERDRDRGGCWPGCRATPNG